MAKTIKRILYATDFSKASNRALDEAINLAKQNKAELLVVNVIEPTRYVAGEEFGSAEIYTRLEEMATQNAETSMRKLLQRLKKHAIKIKSLLLRGAAHDQVIKAARKHQADIIVIGTHGRTGLSKLFMGSVAGRIVSMAQRPVLTVRGR